MASYNDDIWSRGRLVLPVPDSSRFSRRGVFRILDMAEFPIFSIRLSMLVFILVSLEGIHFSFESL
jgi:hypothetical protein